MELRGRLASVVSLLCPSKKRSVLPYANLLRPLSFGRLASGASLLAASRHACTGILLISKDLRKTRAEEVGAAA